MSGPAPIETVMAAASPGTERTARSMHLFFHIHVPARHRGGTTNRAASPLTLPILAAENDNRVDFRKETNPIVVVEENYRSEDRKSTRLNSSHVAISYAVFCLKKKKTN